MRASRQVFNQASANYEATGPEYAGSDHGTPRPPLAADHDKNSIDPKRSGAVGVDDELYLAFKSIELERSGNQAKIV